MATDTTPRDKGLAPSPHPPAEEEETPLIRCSQCQKEFRWRGGCASFRFRSRWGFLCGGCGNGLAEWLGLPVENEL